MDPRLSARFLAFSGMHRLQCLGITAALLLGCELAFAATTIPGGNVINETWTIAGSPYVIQGDISVPAGAFLHIEPGVEVRCAAFDAQGSGRDPSRVEILISGQFSVMGTAALPVTFKGVSGTRTGWGGIVLASSAQCEMDHSSIQNAANAIYSEAGGSSVQLNDIVLSSNQTAVVISAGSTTVERARIFANDAAISVQGLGSLSMSYAGLHANGRGVDISSASGSVVTINHSTLHSNGVHGVYLSPAARVTVTLKNSVVSGHGFGIYRDGNPVSTIATTYSAIWNRTNFVNATAGPQVILEDPRYADVNGPDNVMGTADDSLLLRADSPCANGSDTDTDMGAYVIYKSFFLPLTFSGNDARVRFISVPNIPNQLESTDDFSIWTPVGNAVTGTGGTFEITHPGARALPRKFYRVRLDYE